MEVISGGEVFQVEGTEVILSAGAIATPQILMLSGVGRKESLDKFDIDVVSDLPGVGKNLRDHPDIRMIWQPGPTLNRPEQEIGPQKVALRYTSEGSQNRNDMIMIMRFSYEIGESGALMITVGIYLADSIGEVSLQSNDIHTQPLLNYNLLSQEYDLRRLREGVRLADQIVTSPSFENMVASRISPDEHVINNNDLWIRGCWKTSKQCITFQVPVRWAQAPKSRQWWINMATYMEQVN